MLQGFPIHLWKYFFRNLKRGTKMLHTVVLVVTAYTALAVQDQGCCFPKQFEVDLGTNTGFQEGGKGQLVHGFIHMSWDTDKRKIGGIGELTIDGKLAKHRQLQDYSKGILYMVTDGKCEMQKLPQGDPGCIPSGTKKIVNGYQGFLPNNALNTSTYEMPSTFPHLEGTQLITVTDECVPIGQIILTEGSMTVNGFSNVKRGISDPSVLDIPPECLKDAAGQQPAVSAEEGGCCFPKQWEAELGTTTGYTQDGKGHVVQGGLHMSFDSDQLKIAGSGVTIIDGVPVKQKQLQDYKSGIMYLVNTPGGNCTKLKLPAIPSSAFCLPASAKQVVSYEGLPGGHMLNVTTYKLPYPGPFFEGEQYMAVTAGDTEGSCVPTGQMILGSSTMVANGYYNVTLGIKDPSVFNIPPECMKEEQKSNVGNDKLYFSP